MTVADFGALMVVADRLDVTGTQFQEWAESIRNLAVEILHDQPARAGGVVTATTETVTVDREDLSTLY